jgi:murein L,D-transpeptidase YcbB/YkuD
VIGTAVALSIDVRVLRSVLAPAVLIALCACKSAPNPHEVTPALERVMAGEAPPKVEPSTWPDVRAFYTQRQAVPAWVDHRRPTEKAARIIALLGTARQHGFDPADYGAAELLEMSQSVETIDKASPARLEQLALFEARMTAGLIRFGRDVAVGREKGDANWKTRRTAPDVVAAVAGAADDPDTFIDRVRPPHAEYVALQKALDDLNGQKEKGGWVKVPSAKAVNELRQRLLVSGHLKGSGIGEQGSGSGDRGSRSSKPDEELRAAVKSFQELHSLPATGVVDQATLGMLNVPLDWRIQQVAINLQRWRYMPDDLGERHFIVNIPYFHLTARESGKPVMDIRVVVGKPGQNTPIFSEEMETVVFSPYWNIPDTIAENETAPAVARDPGYLARQGIEVLRVSSSGTETVDAGNVNWDNAESLKGLVFRQKPGAGNALGHVKFLFPNRHNVYLHDTPADALFARPGRAFSHGCVRVEEPEMLAKYVLRDHPEWTDEAIFAAMRAGVEKHVKLKRKIPVHITYFTSWVDENGGLHFQPDIYGYDRPRGN